MKKRFFKRSGKRRFSRRKRQMKKQYVKVSRGGIRL